MDFLNSQWHSTLCVDSRTGGRAENQDCTASQDTPFGLLSVVCDGMGGGKAGRNASTLAAQAVLQYCKQAPAAKLPDVVLTEAPKTCCARTSRNTPNCSEWALPASQPS